MALGDTHKTEQLIEDIKRLGYPQIIDYYHGGRIHMAADSHKVSEFGIKLFAGNSECFISILSAYLLEKDRPDNVVARCRRCYEVMEYEVMEKEIGKSMFTLYWPEG
jgi:hypothetical protein